MAEEVESIKTGKNLNVDMEGESASGAMERSENDLVTKLLHALLLIV